jgi:hypothetical protein
VEVPEVLVVDPDVGTCPIAEHGGLLEGCIADVAKIGVDELISRIGGDFPGIIEDCAQLGFNQDQATTAACALSLLCSTVGHTHPLAEAICIAGPIADGLKGCIESIYVQIVTGPDPWETGPVPSTMCSAVSRSELLNLKSACGVNEAKQKCNDCCLRAITAYPNTDVRACQDQCGKDFGICYLDSLKGKCSCAGPANAPTPEECLPPPPPPDFSFPNLCDYAEFLREIRSNEDPCARYCRTGQIECFLRCDEALSNCPRIEYEDPYAY